MGQNLIASIDGVVTTKKVADKGERDKMVGIVAGYLKKPTVNVLAVIKKFFAQEVATKKVDQKVVKKVEKKLAKEARKSTASGSNATVIVKDIAKVEVPKEVEKPHEAPRRRGEH